MRASSSRFLRGLAGLYQFRRQSDQAARLGREILALAEREDNPTMLIDGHLVLATTLMFGNDLQGGTRSPGSRDRAVRRRPGAQIRRPRRELIRGSRVSPPPRSLSGSWASRIGRPAGQGRAHPVGELDHPFTTAFARFHSGLLHLWRREFGIVHDRAESLLEVAGKHDFQIWTAAGTCLLGAAQAGLGRFEEGLANIRIGMDLYQGLRSPPIFWTMLLWLDAAAKSPGGTAG